MPARNKNLFIFQEQPLGPEGAGAAAQDGPGHDREAILRPVLGDRVRPTARGFIPLKKNGREI